MSCRGLGGAADELPAERTRRPGGGRKRAIDKDETLLADLDALVEPATLGDPGSPLRWTSKSVRNLAGELAAMGHEFRMVARLLNDNGYSLQANRKTSKGCSTSTETRSFTILLSASVVSSENGISVDTKKKELVGDFKNPGRERRPKGKPEPVRVYDFLIPDQGKAIHLKKADLLSEGWGVPPLARATCLYVQYSFASELHNYLARQLLRVSDCLHQRQVCKRSEWMLRVASSPSLSGALGTRIGI